MKRLVLLLITGIVILGSGCVKKDFDRPPVGNIPVGDVYTISELRQMYIDNGATQIQEDASVYGVVTMDESSGNIYKSAYIQDAEDAVNLHLKESGGVRVGDSIRVYLKDVVLSEYSGMFQLDNVHNDSNIIILANERYLTPKVVSLQELNTGDYQAQLVRVNGVQFMDTELGKNWADEESSANRNLEDCDDNNIIVRSSNYANFAELELPSGKGTLVAISSVFGTTQQLILRTITEVDMNEERCEGGGGNPITPVDEVKEYFDNAVDYENINIDGWTNRVVSGDRYWQGKTFNDDKYAQATGYNSNLDAMEVWLISPPVINTSGDKKLSFKSAMAYWEHMSTDPIEVKVSLDYDGTNFETATWTDLNPVLPTSSSSNYAWIESGVISLADYIGNVAVAFKYTGSGTESTSIQIDDVVIAKEGGGPGGITPVEKVDEDFSGYADYDDINKSDWMTFMVAGDRAWQAKTYQSETYAQATGYNSGLDDMETWMVTPPVINTDGSLKLSFKSAMAFWNHSGEVFGLYASTEYDGTNFESITWTEITANVANQSSGDHTWVESGEIDLSAFVGNVAIAFKYKGSGTESTSYRIDDVLIDSEGGGGGNGVTSFFVDFSDQVNYEPIQVDGWINEATIGTRDWQGKAFDDELYAQATSYNSAEENECWLISPMIDLDAMNNPTLEFLSAQAYWAHDGLTVYISTDFNGADIEAASWEVLNCTLAGSSTPDHEWLSSGQVDLSDYSGSAYVAFQYIGSDSGGNTTSYRLDDIQLYDE